MKGEDLPLNIAEALKKPLAPALLTPEQTAARLNVTPKDLARWRRTRPGQAPVGPPWVKLTARAVRYRAEDVDRYIADKTRGGAR